MSAKRTKRIFISDLHMGDKRSNAPGEGLHRYVWLYEPRTTMLANFLQSVYNSDDVKEVIILGDLFDQWVFPTNFTPPSYSDIANAPLNVNIVKALKDIAGHDEMKLYYVPGNHDMLISKKELSEIIPNIELTFFNDKNDWPKKGEGVYRGDAIAAEHGNMYTLFCAPDTWDFKGGILPVGFFISRVVASKKALYGKGTDTIDIIEKFIKAFFKEKYLAKDVFEAIAEDAKLKSPEIITDLDNKPSPMTVDQVGNSYKNSFEEWGKHTPTGLSSISGVICEATGLAEDACKEYFRKDETKIVVMGHTHKWKLDGYIGESYVPDSPFEFIPCSHIYANSGTWINSHKMATYVETEIDRDEKRHYVRVFKYTENNEKKKLKERYIDL
ncbi:MAG: hypothetical protein GY757_02550 [bacterium]|nr:hypothetical protein [bacterium]